MFGSIGLWEILMPVAILVFAPVIVMLVKKWRGTNSDSDSDPD